MREFSLFELFFGALPEMCLFVVGAYVLCKAKVDLKKGIIIALVSGLFNYTIRFLQIQPGINILLTFPALAVLLIYIARIEAFKVFKSVLILIVIRIATEWFTFMIMDLVLHLSLDDIMLNPLKKTLWAYPSLLFFALIIYIIYLVMRLKLMRKNIYS